MFSDSSVYHTNVQCLPVAATARGETVIRRVIEKWTRP